LGLLEAKGVHSWEHLAILVALKACEDTDGGNRIGFQFASFDIASEDGGGSDVKGSMQRVATYAAILRQHERAKAVIEAHTGPTAPTGIAHAYSVQRAKLITAELARLGVMRERITPIGNGKQISASRAVRSSVHPNAGSAARGYGWAEIFLHIDGVELPPRPDYYPPSERTCHASFSGVRAEFNDVSCDDNDDSDDGDIRGRDVHDRRRFRCIVC